MKLKIEGNQKGFSFVLEDMPETSTELLTLLGYIERVKLVILKKIKEETDNYEILRKKDDAN